MAAAVAARLGRSLQDVAAEARGGLAPKAEHVGDAPTAGGAPLAEATMPGGPEASIRLVVANAVGLHARPAALIAEKAGSLGSTVTLATPGGTPVDASSALMIMTLGAKKGDQVEVSGDDQADVDAIAAMVEEDLDA